MLKLRHSTTSPFVRKVVVTALETGQDGEIERVKTVTSDPALGADNPLQKIPAMILDDGTKLIESAIQLGFVSEEQALKAVGEEVGIEFIDLAETDVDLSLLTTFPQKLIHRQSLFPIRKEFGQLVVATSNPFDLYPLDEVSAATGLPVMPVLASRNEIAKLIKKHLGVGSETVEGLMAAAEEDDGVELLSDIETEIHRPSCSSLT